MKYTLIIAALLGSMTYTDVQAVSLEAMRHHHKNDDAKKNETKPAAMVQLSADPVAAPAAAAAPADAAPATAAKTAPAAGTNPPADPATVVKDAVASDKEAKKTEETEAAIVAKVAAENAEQDAKAAAKKAGEKTPE